MSREVARYYSYLTLLVHSYNSRKVILFMFYYIYIYKYSKILSNIAPATTFIGNHIT